MINQSDYSCASPEHLATDNTNNQDKKKKIFKAFKIIPIHWALQRTVTSYKLNLLYLDANSSFLLISLPTNEFRPTERL